MSQGSVICYSTAINLYGISMNTFITVNHSIYLIYIYIKRKHANQFSMFMLHFDM